MKTLIVGAGLIGVTTAYFLSQHGHEVTVVDRQEGPGLETSFANGALLTPSMSDPWNAPGSWRVLLASLARSDAPLKLHLDALPGLLGWGVTFLRNSRVSAYRYNTLCNLRLALFSREVMQRLRRQTNVEYTHCARGSLRVFRDAAALDQACIAAEHLVGHGLPYRRLSTVETVELEPGLAPISQQLAGGVHYASDETGDAYRFCVGLTEHTRRAGVEFLFRKSVTSIEMRCGRVLAVVADGQRLSADRYVVAAGSHSTTVLSSAGIRLPVRPAKGYSLTLDNPGKAAPLEIPVIDDSLHAVVVPLGDNVRVAGTAEFAGYDLKLPRPRIDNLRTLLQEILPTQPFDSATERQWCGLRAMSADGVPIIGYTPVPNLLVSTGHGHLGWTMAAGSAQLLADLVSGSSSVIDATPYQLTRFANY